MRITVQAITLICFVICTAASAIAQPSGTLGIAPQQSLGSSAPDIRNIAWNQHELAWEDQAHQIFHALGGDDTIAYFGVRPKVQFVQAQYLHASVSRSGTLYLTSGMLDQIRSSSEFAFVVSHELAHIMLEHHHSYGRSPQHSLQLELDADKLAVRLMQEAGYDPQAANRFLYRLVHPERGSTYEGLNLRTVYPSLGLRLSALEQQGTVVRKIQ